MSQTNFDWTDLCREESLKEIISIQQLCYFFTNNKYNIPSEEKEKAAIIAYCVYKEKMGFINHEELETEIGKIGLEGGLLKNVSKKIFYETFHVKPTKYNQSEIGSRLFVDSSEVAQTKNILKIFGDTEYFKNKTVKDWMSRENRRLVSFNCSMNGLRIIENLFNYRNDFKESLNEAVEIFYNVIKNSLVGVRSILNKQTQKYELVNTPKLDLKKNLDLGIRINQYLNLKEISELVVDNNSFAMQNLKNLESYKNIFEKLAEINNDSAPLYKNALKKLDDKLKDDNFFGFDEDNPYRQLEMAINLNVMLKTYNKKERDLVNTIDTYLKKLFRADVLSEYNTFEMRHPSGKNIKRIVAFFSDDVLNDGATELENIIKKQLKMIANNEYLDLNTVADDFKVLLDDSVMRKSAGEVNVVMKPRKF